MQSRPQSLRYFYTADGATLVGRYFIYHSYSERIAVSGNEIDSCNTLFSARTAVIFTTARLNLGK